MSENKTKIMKKLDKLQAERDKFLTKLESIQIFLQDNEKKILEAHKKREKEFIDLHIQYKDSNNSYENCYIMGPFNDGLFTIELDNIPLDRCNMGRGPNSLKFSIQKEYLTKISEEWLKYNDKI